MSYIYFTRKDRSDINYKVFSQIICFASGGVKYVGEQSTILLRLSEVKKITALIMIILLVDCNPTFNLLAFFVLYLL